MKSTTIRKSLLLVSLASVFAIGCELIVDFDRTKIPVEGTDTGTPGDSSVTETGSDAAEDASDASDAAPDVVEDVSDAGEDADADAN